MALVANHPFGFEWVPSPDTGGSHIKVMRRTHIRRGKGAASRSLEIQTPRQSIDVYVSPTGLIRVFKGREEMKVTKDGPQKA